VAPFVKKTQFPAWKKTLALLAVAALVLSLLIAVVQGLAFGR